MALPGGYQAPMAAAGATLSGGQRQRIAIARAMLKDALIVLLDEATSAIDATNDRLIQTALAELTRAKTVLVVAHRLPTIGAADQILVLDAGRIVERGDHPSILAAGGRYGALWAEREHAARWRISP